MKNRALVEQWLSRTLSNLDRARAGKVRDTVLRITVSEFPTERKWGKKPISCSSHS